MKQKILNWVRNPKVQVGLRLFITALVVILGDVWTAAAGTAIANAPFGFEIDKAGLEGDNLKFVNDFEKRMKLKGSPMTKEQVELEVRSMLKPYEGLDLEKLREMVGDTDKGIRSILLKQGEDIKKLQQGIEDPNAVLSVRSQVAKWQEKNKEDIEAIRSGSKRNLPALEIRVASPMTVANTVNVGQPNAFPVQRVQVEAGVNDPVRRAPTFWDYIRKGYTNSPLYIWVNKINPLGAAGFIGPGVLKPGISFELETENSNAKKIAVSLKTSTELLQDVDGMTTFIEQELRFALDDETNVKLMTGNNSSTVPAGLQSLSVAYSLVGVSTTNANNWDALVANEAQLRAGNLKGRVVHFVNPVDYANMRLTKAVSQGQLFVPNLSGGEIVEDNNIPVGYVQSVLIDYYRILIYKDFQVTMGWENDDFTKNLVTFLGERRIHQFVNGQYTGFAIYDTFANIKAAIEEA